jgi:tripartite-type tricarboxylate transporter receptor subunit TctC
MDYKDLLRRQAILGALALPLASPALAQGSGRPIRILIPAVAGGGSDISTRILLPRLAAELGQPAIADNRPGGSGNLANELLAQAAPDGLTLLHGTIGSLVVNPLVQKNLPVDPLRDFVQLGTTVQVTNLLVSPADRPWRDVAGLIAAARARPGELSYGSSGVGSAGHLAGALFDQAAGIETLHVPYRGGGQLITDIISGKLDFSFATAATTLEHVQTGRLRALAVPSPQRSPLAPGVPTIGETGLPGYAVLNWYAMAAPRGFPPNQVQRVNAALRAALADREAVAKLAQQAIEPLPSSPEEGAAFMAAERAKWAALVAAAKISLD